MVTALRAQNVGVSGGSLDEEKLAVPVRVDERFEELHQIERTVVSPPGAAKKIYVSDLAEVKLTYKDPRAVVRSKGQLALAINAQRKVGTNVMKVMADFRAAVKGLNDPGGLLEIQARRLGLTGKIEAVQVYDQTIYIDHAINLVQTNIFVGGTIALIVLYLFLRSGRSTMIVALAIPMSIIGTFVAMVLMGRNVNVISLAGLAFAVGMVVDNAIVVLENIDRHRKLGKDGPQAALDGAREVWGAVLASTLTTVVVFLPVIFVQEEAGQLFRDIALAICAAVTLSLIVSVMVIPSAAARLLRRRAANTESADLRTADRKTEPNRSGALVERVSQLIYFLMGSWPLRAALVASIVVIALFGSWLLMPPTSYLPTGNRNLVFAMLFPPPGYNTDFQLDIGKRVEVPVRPFWEAKPGSVEADRLPAIPTKNFATGEVGQVVPPPITNFFFVGIDSGIMFCGAISADDRRVDPVAALINHTIEMQPGIFGGARKMPLIRTPGGSGNTIELEIFEPSLDEVVPAATAIFEALADEFGHQGLQTNPGNFTLGRKEVHVKLNAVTAPDVGVTNASLGDATQMFGDGVIAGEFLLDGDGIDLKVIANNRHSDDATYMRDQPIATATGQVVQLQSVAHIETTIGPQQIKRIAEQQAVTIDVELPEDIALDTGQATIREKLIGPLREQGAIPPTVNVELAGTAAKLSQVKQALLGRWTGLNFQSIMGLISSRAFLALLVVFLLMAALFENWLYPLVIMVSVPLAAVGGFLGLRIVHTFVPTQQLDVLTMLGFVILTGVVVNNAILLVHQALNFMRGTAQGSGGATGERMPPRQAIAESVRTRMRPIFMSTLTSIGGMQPLVLFPGAGSELYRGLGSVMVGGLIISTLFTLFLVPLLLSLVLDIRMKLTGSAGTDAAAV